MELEWFGAKELKSPDLIAEFEHMFSYTFCESYKRCVMKNNGGKPNKHVFDTEKEPERVFDTLLSFDPEDPGNIWTYQYWDDDEAGLKDKYICFADSCFGDPICFDRRDDSVVFVDHETGSVEKIADSFDDFLNCLYVDTEFEEIVKARKPIPL